VISTATSGGDKWRAAGNLAVVTATRSWLGRASSTPAVAAAARGAVAVAVAGP
jgi:hypothetical protein